MRNVAAWYAIVIALSMAGVWAMFFATGHIPELHTKPVEFCFHLADEGITAVLLMIAGIGLLRRWPPATKLLLVAYGLLLYTVIASAGYFAQRGDWATGGIFLGLTLATVVMLTLTLRASDMR